METSKGREQKLDNENGIDVPTVESNPEDLPSIPGAALVLT